jgi:hypothetical protein
VSFLFEMRPDEVGEGDLVFYDEDLRQPIWKDPSAAG